MKRISLFILLNFGIGIACYAQQITISGQVTDKEANKPLPGVMVTIRPDGENKIVKFVQTSGDGRFEIKLDSVPGKHHLYFSMMGFAAQSIPLSAAKTVYNIQLSEKVTELKEVVVKAPAIHERGDTITYVVSSFADAQDKSLADVLKKMPGIEVEKSGAIKYNGVSINKFYIEGRDMLEGRYGLATNNIHQKDVGSVEVMENHQPIKALEDISFSQNPAINIKLKEDAKSRWAGTVNLGTGFEPFLWNAELFAMRFTAKMQTLNTYKTNNTGIDLVREMQVFSIDEILSQFAKSYRLNNYINVSPGYMTDIDVNRLLFNKTHMVSSNNLWALSKHYDLSTQVSYLKNRKESNNYTETTYFLNDGTMVIEEDEHADQKQNRVSTDFTLTANTPRFYLRNKLNTTLQWDDTDMQLSGSYPNLQRADVGHRQFSNDLEIVKRAQKKIFTVSSYNLYQAKPQHLMVVRDGETQRQEVESSAFFTNTHTSFSLYLNPFTVSVKTGVVGVIRSMGSELYGIADSLGELSNSLLMKYMNLYASPELEFKRNGFEAKFDAPFSFLPYVYSDKLTDEQQDKSKLFLSPRLHLRYFLTSRLSVSTSGRIAQNPVEEQQFYRRLLLRNYRRLSQGFIDFNTGNSRSINFGLSYRNPLKALFSNATIHRSWNYLPRYANQLFLRDYLLQTYIPQENHSSMWFFSGNISKGIDAINGMVFLQGSFSSSDAALYQNSVRMPYVSETWNVSSKINSRIARWCNITYELRYGNHVLELQQTGSHSSRNDLSQLVSYNVTPQKSWYVRFTTEHYYNELSENLSKHFILADADFTYTFKSGWELNLSVKNLFDQKRYDYTQYDGLSSLYKSFVIRPRNIMASAFFRF